MEKHQILRPRRLPNTPFLKLSHKAALVTGAVSVAIALIYDRWRSDSVVYVIKSGYYHDEDLEQHVMRMSLMSLFSLKTKDAMGERIEEEEAVSSMSSRPLSIPEASINH